MHFWDFACQDPNFTSIVFLVLIAVGGLLTLYMTNGKNGG